MYWTFRLSTVQFKRCISKNLFQKTNEMQPWGWRNTNPRPSYYYIRHHTKCFVTNNHASAISPHALGIVWPLFVDAPPPPNGQILKRGSWRGKMGTGIDLFLDWENGIWVAGTGIWPLGMGNEVLKNGNGIEVMRVDSQFFHVLSILNTILIRFRCLWSWFLLLTILFTALPCEQAYSGARNSGFSDYACPQVTKSDAQRNKCLVSSIYFI